MVGCRRGWDYVAEFVSDAEIDPQALKRNYFLCASRHD
jgi:hypothetical protein